MIIKVVMFDLGGVLVDWDGTTPLVKLSCGRLTREQARRFWLESAWVRRLETGQCNLAEFASGAVSELKLEAVLTPGEFLAAFRSWDKGPYPGAEKILRQVQSRYALACLSNNNALHWSNPALQSVLQFFRYCFVSFETGLLKPDRAAFEQAIRKVGVPPEQILFLDDNIECIREACACGLKARRTAGLAAVQRALTRFGIECQA